jgi:hypothetical protein
MALTSLAITCVRVQPSLAVPFAESGDAGKLPATAQVITGPSGTSISKITAALGFAGDVDMFALLIPNPALFSATVAALGGSFVDSQLFLFNTAGLGVRANDDAIGLRSRLPVGSLGGPAGLYYLAISDYDNDPVSATGAIFPDTPFTTVHGPTGSGGASPITSWDNSMANESGTYRITFTGATVVSSTTPTPEPSAYILFGSGLVGMLGYGWRKQRQVA